jgi:hypothetical protein
MIHLDRFIGIALFKGTRLLEEIHAHRIPGLPLLAYLIEPRPDRSVNGIGIFPGTHPAVTLHELPQGMIEPDRLVRLTKDDNVGASASARRRTMAIVRGDDLLELRPVIPCRNETGSVIRLADVARIL